MASAAYLSIAWCSLIDARTVRLSEGIFFCSTSSLPLVSCLIVQGTCSLSSLIPASIMGMEYLMSSSNASSGLRWHGNQVADEVKRPQGLSTETKMAACQTAESRNGPIRCPIPCKSSRWYKEHNFGAAQDLSDFLVSKASPPYFTGSPPVRATNPLVHDTEFCALKVQSGDQSLGVPIPTRGFNARSNVRSFTNGPS